MQTIKHIRWSLCDVYDSHNVMNETFCQLSIHIVQIWNIISMAFQSQPIYIYSWRMSLWFKLFTTKKICEKSKHRRLFLCRLLLCISCWVFLIQREYILTLFVYVHKLFNFTSRNKTKIYKQKIVSLLRLVFLNSNFQGEKRTSIGIVFICWQSIGKFRSVLFFESIDKWIYVNFTSNTFK